MTFAFGMWLVVYPLVTGLLLMLRTIAPALPLPAQTLLMSAVLVPTIVFLVAPLVTRLTGFGATDQPNRTTER